MKKLKLKIKYLLLLFKKKLQDNKIVSSIESNENIGDVSMPFVITIKNELDIPIENFSLFSDYKENEKYFDENGNLVKDGLTISSDVFEISYKKICENFKINSFKIGLTYIRSLTSNQVLQSFTVKYQNANGLFFGRKYNPTIDPNQSQINIIAQKTNYTLDENTSIIYSKIHPKTSLSLYFYPSEEILDKKDNENEQVARFILYKKN